MCGIVGVICKGNNVFSTIQEKVFEDLLYVDALRGEDSTGVIIVDKDETFHIAKEASPPAWFLPQLMQQESYKKMWTKGRAAIGHNRKKTMGKIEDATAHPFVVEDNFAMVHNGTLNNHLALAQTEVDSEALAIVLQKAFSEDDYKATLEDTLGKVNGAYAVAMYDQRKHMVRLLRNKDRPLAMVDTATHLYFASEASMLYWILQRHSLMMNQMNKVEIVPEHVLIEVDLESGAVSKTEITPKKFLPAITTTTTTTTTTKPTKNSYTTNARGFTYTKQKQAQPAMSKNAFKKLKRSLLGKKIQWWVEDYVEVHFPKTELDGETLFWIMGSCDTMDEDHVIKTIVDLKELTIDKGSDLADKLWIGTVDRVTYDKATKKLIVYLGDTYPAPISYRSSKDVVDADYIQRKLDEKEKALVTLH